MATAQEKVVLKISADTTRLINQMKQAENRVNKSTQNMTSSINKFKSAIRNIAVGSGAFFATKKFVDYADNWTNINSKIRLVTGSTQELNIVQSELVKLAQETRSDLDGTVTLYTKMSRATKELGYSGNELLGITKTINQAMIVSGASAIEAKSALLQLSQGMSSMVLRGEELNSVMENTPRLAQAIANGMGVAMGELRSMGAEGKITTDIIVEALKNQASVISEEYKSMPMTVGQSFTNMQTAVTKQIGIIDESMGISKGLAGTVQELTQYVTTNFANIAMSIKNAIPYIISLGKMFVAYKITMLAVNTAMATYNAIVSISIAKMITFRNVLRTSGIGLVVTGLSALMGAFDSTSVSMDNANQSAKDFKNTLKGLSDAQRTLTSFKLGDQIAEQASIVRSAKTELTDSIRNDGWFSEEKKRLNAIYDVENETLSLLKEKKIALDNYVVSKDKEIEKERILNQVKAKAKETSISAKEEAISLSMALRTVNDNARNASQAMITGATLSANAMKHASEATKHQNDLLNSSMDIVGGGLSSAFRQSMDAGFDWGDAMKGILKDVLTEMFRVLVVKKAIEGIALGNYVSDANAVASSYQGASAKGNVVTSTGYDKAFAKGGVVDSPTLFGMGGNQTGLMGEAGAEAIMPLGRMANGDLGVQGVALNVNVINNAGVDVQTSQEGEDFTITLERIDSALADGVRRNTSSLSQAIRGAK